MPNVFQLAPLISMTVTILAFCIVLTCLMMRPSAKRTILLTTPLLVNIILHFETSLIQTFKEKEKKSKRKKSPKPPENVNPIYMWMVQPKEETGLKEGEFGSDFVKL